ncbi:MAG: ecdysteroid 22-kinase family protein [Acidimicrobiia bacterium]|nr:ecdysteroid 22-kinase family protein [Acidimicrobiia bacterium]
MIDIPSSIDEVTAAWLATALSTADAPVEVAAVSASPVGTGQMADSFRVQIDYTAGSGPATVVVKLAAQGELSRAAGAAGGYRNEVRYYRELHDTVAVRAPVCHRAEVTDDSTAFVLVLEDLAPAEQGDQIGGCTIEQACAAVDNLAGLHGPRWCDASLFDLDWLSRADPEAVVFGALLLVDATARFNERYADRLDQADAEVFTAYAQKAEAWLLGRSERFGLVHGDYRLDNLLFGTAAGGDAVATVDWQTISIGLPARDLAYFCGNGLTIDDRRVYERELVEHYHRALQAHGVSDYDIDTCWDDYRFGHFQGPWTTILGAMHVEQTDRGDDMFMAMASRCGAAIRDLDSLELLG